MKCFWDECQAEVQDIDFMEHISQHVGFQRLGTFEKGCKWSKCRASKPTRSKMMSHVVSHLELRTHKCHCRKTFKRKSDLSTHQDICKSKFDRIVDELFLGLPLSPLSAPLSPLQYFSQGMQYFPY